MELGLGQLGSRLESPVLQPRLVVWPEEAGKGEGNLCRSVLKGTVLLFPEDGIKRMSLSQY